MAVPTPIPEEGDPSAQGSVSEERLTTSSVKEDDDDAGSVALSTFRERDPGHEDS